MRNYKLNLVDTWGVFGKTRAYSEDKHDKLLEMGWNYNDMFKQYTKRVVSFCDAVLDINRESLLFYSSRYFTPAELNYYLNNNKDEIKKVHNAIKEIKDLGYFK